ncbi:MAG: VOC family protein [Mobilicoccus sp.]|nr:VOC family protein [Mobilicoccus sp.]
MRLENIVIDAADPRTLGAFWRDAVGARTLTWEPDLVEVRVELDGFFYDLCLPRVDDIDNTSPRAHVDLGGGTGQSQLVDRLLMLGATTLDIGQGDVEWDVLADPEGNPLCVLEYRPEYEGAGPVAGIPIDCVDPDVDQRFWAELIGWEECAGKVPSLRHPSGRGFRLEFCPEFAPKARKNHLHLDVRPETSTLPEAVARACDLGARQVDLGYGELPWVTMADPSGNEFCILPPESHA